MVIQSAGGKKLLRVLPDTSAKALAVYCRNCKASLTINITCDQYVECTEITRYGQRIPRCNIQSLKVSDVPQLIRAKGHQGRAKFRVNDKE